MLELKENEYLELAFQRVVRTSENYVINSNLKKIYLQEKLDFRVSVQITCFKFFKERKTTSIKITLSGAMLEREWKKLKL